MNLQNNKKVPKFKTNEILPKKNKYCLCIPIINEKDRILIQLKRAQKNGVDKIIDIIICDGGSTDGSNNAKILKEYGVNTLLIKDDKGRQGAQLRMGFFFALERGYDGIITIDGNNKDSIEDVYKFIEKLEEGYDFIQGSRYIKGGKAINTPLVRHLSVKLLHAPIISLTAFKKYTDTTNAYRGYSKKYLTHSKVDVFRDVFDSYELLAYLSVRADQLGLKTCEIPVTRQYPKKGKTPTKISPVKGNYNLLKILFLNMFGRYNPNKEINKNVIYLFLTIISLILVFIIRLIMYAKLAPIYMTPDSYEYDAMNAFKLLIEGPNMARVFVYPLIIDLFKIFSRNNYLVLVTYFQIIISFISLLYMLFINLKLTKKKYLSLIITIIYGLSFTIFGWDKTILTESLALSGIVILIYYIIKMLENNMIKNYILVALLSTILLFLRPSFIYLIILFFAFTALNFIIKKTKTNLIKVGIGIVPLFILLIYCIAYYVKFDVFTYSSTSISQAFTIAQQNGYDMTSSNQKILKIIEKDGSDYTWLLIKKEHLWKDVTLKEIENFNKEVYGKNKTKYLSDKINLTFELADWNYVAYYDLIKDNNNIFVKTLIQISSFIWMGHLYIFGFIFVVLTIIKMIRYKQIPIIDTLLCGLYLAPIAIAIIGTNAEYPRTSITVLPILFIYLAIVLCYLFDRKLKLNFGHEFFKDVR